MYEKCASCGGTEQETMLNRDSKCVPCVKVEAADPEDGIPVEAVMKLVQMAESRHPTVCNEDAARFRRVLEDAGLLPVPPSR